MFWGVRDGELGSGGQVGKGLEHPDGDEGLLSKLFWGVSGGQVGKGLEHTIGDEEL